MPAEEHPVANLSWVDGPPPDGFHGLILAVLDEAEVKVRFPLRIEHHGPAVDYYGDPVAVEWRDEKGHETFGQWCITPGLVVRHVVLTQF